MMLMGTRHSFLVFLRESGKQLNGRGEMCCSDPVLPGITQATCVIFGEGVSSQ